MRNFKFALASVSLMFLSNCATSGGGGLTKDQITALIQQIQAYTSQACSYRPQVQGVAALIAAMFPEAGAYATIVNTVGAAICNAPITLATRKRGVGQITRVVQTPQGPITVTGVTYGAGR